MQNSKKIVLVAGAGAFAWFFIRLRTAAKNLIFKAEAVNIQKIELLYTTLKIDYSVINPAGQSISIKSFAGNIAFNGSQIGTFNNLTKFSIPGSGIYKGSFEVRLSNIGAAKQLISFVSLGQKKEISISGVIFTPFGNSNFSQNVAL
jgi:hypothetical protein